MKLYLELLSFFNRKERVLIGGIILAWFLGAIFDALGISSLMFLIAWLHDPQIVFQYRALNWAYQFSKVNSLDSFIMLLSVIFVLLFVFKNIYLIFVNWLQFRFIYKAQSACARRLFQTYLLSPYPFFLHRNSSELLRNVAAEVTGTFHNITSQSLIVISELLVVVAILVTLILLTNATTTLTMIGLIGGIAYFFGNVVRKKLAEHGQRHQHLTEQVYKWANQGFGGIKEIKVLGRESYFVDKFSCNYRQYAFSFLYFQMVSIMPRYIIETIVVVIMLSLTLTLLFIKGQPAESLLPTLGLFTAASFRLMPSVSRILGMLSSIKFFRPAVHVVYRDLSSLKSDGLPDTKAGKAISIVPRLSFKEAIELRNINYKYPNSETIALQNISLAITKGQSIALVGKSGAGKTTLVNILLGLLKPTFGEILIDKYVLDDNCITGWQRNVGYVPQSLYFIDDTIRRNIAFGLLDDQIEDDRVWAALGAAQLQDMVSRLPDKLETLVGERGVRLSGGEQQRLGIARCFYHDPEVLILDEATSSLDLQTEQEVFETIERLVGSKTLIIVSHRITTVKNADAIYLMQEGKVVRRVSYQDLVNNITQGT